MVTRAYTRKDTALMRTKALPTAAAGATSTDPIDTQNGPNGHHLAPIELEAIAPALDTTMLPDTRTATYILEHADALDSNGALDTPATLVDAFIVQTGAASAGAASVTTRVRLPSDVKRYVGLKCTLGASTTNSSAVSMRLDVLV